MSTHIDVCARARTRTYIQYTVTMMMMILANIYFLRFVATSVDIFIHVFAFELCVHMHVTASSDLYNTIATFCH